MAPITMVRVPDLVSSTTAVGTHLICATFVTADQITPLYQFTQAIPGQLQGQPEGAQIVHQLVGQILEVYE